MAHAMRAKQQPAIKSHRANSKENPLVSTLLLQDYNPKKDAPKKISSLSPRPAARNVLTDQSNFKSPPPCSSSINIAISDPFEAQLIELGAQHHGRTLVSKAFYALLSNSMKVKKPTKQTDVQLSEQHQLKQVFTTADNKNQSLTEPQIVSLTITSPSFTLPMHTEIPTTPILGHQSLTRLKMAEQFSRMSLAMKTMVAWKRHGYVIKQVRKRREISEQVAKQHYLATLCLKVLKALLKMQKVHSPPAQGPVEIADLLPIKDEKCGTKRNLDQILLPQFKNQNSDLVDLDRNFYLSQHQVDTQIFSQDSYLNILSRTNSYSARLMTIAFTALKHYPNQQIKTAQSHRKQTLCNKLLRVLASHLKIARLERKQSQLLGQKNKTLIQTSLKAWHRLLQITQLARNYRRWRTLVQGFKGLIKQRERAMKLVQADKQLRLFSVRQCFQKLKMKVEQGRKRQDDCTKFKGGKQAKVMHQFFKVWFNQVSLTRRHKKLQVLTNKTHTDVLKSTFHSWKLTHNLNDLKRKTYTNFLQKFFQPWLRLSIKKSHTRLSLTLRYAARLNSTAMQQWKLFTKNSKQKKRRLMNLYQLRASSIQRVAFESLLEHHQHLKLKKSMNKLACVYLAARLQRKGLLAFRKVLSLMKLAKQTKAKHQYLLARQTVQIWSVDAKHNRKLAKFEHKQTTKVKLAIFKQLRVYAKQRLIKKNKAQICLRKYARNLQRQAWSKFGQMMQRKYHREVKTSKAAKRYDKSLLSYALTAIVNYSSRKYYLKHKRSQIVQLRQTNLMSAALNGLMQNLCYESMKKTALPLVKKRKLEIKYRCFMFLQRETVEKRESRNLVKFYKKAQRERIQQQVIESLQIYAQHSHVKKHLHLQAEEFRAFQLKRVAMKGLILKHLHAAVDGSHTKMIQSNLRSTLFVRWYEYVHDYLPKIRLADLHLLKTRFMALHRYSKQRAGVREQRRKLTILQHDYGQARLAHIGLTWLYLHSQHQIYFRSRLELCDRIWLKRLLTKWQQVVPLLKIKNRLAQQIKEFRSRQLLLKANQALKRHARSLIRSRQLVGEFRHNCQQRLKLLIIAQIIDQAHETKLKALRFVDMMQPIVLKSKTQALMRWIVYHTWFVKLEMGDQFYCKNAGLKLIGKCFKEIKIHKLQSQKKQNKKRLAESHFFNRCGKVALIKLQIFTFVQRQKLYKINLIRSRARQQTLQLCYQQLVRYYARKQVHSHQVRSIKKLHCQRLKRLVVWSLLRNRQTKNIANLVHESHKTLVRTRFCTEWLEQHRKYQIVQKMVESFQRQNTLKLVHNFIPLMHRAGQLQQLRTKKDFEAGSGLMRKAFNAFKSLIALKSLNEQKINGFRMRKVKMIMQAMIQLLSAQVDHRCKVEQQIDCQRLQQSQEMKCQIMNEFRQNRFNEIAKRQANFYVSKLRKQRALKTLREYCVRRQNLRFREKQISSIKFREYFQLWHQASQQFPRERAAEQVIWFTKLRLVFLAIKDHTEQSIKVRQFKLVWQQKRLKYLGVRAFQSYLVIQQFRRLVEQRITNQRQHQMKHDAFRLLEQGCSNLKLRAGLTYFWKHKMVKQYFDAFRAYVDDKNRQRINLIKIRAAFVRQPGLKRPLLVIRSPLLYRVFLALKMKTQRQREVRSYTQLASYAVYLRLQRKAFYGLRLNAAQKFQQHTSIRLKKLQIQRRWFQALQVACLEQKRSKQSEITAMVARFLNLQRKAMKALVVNYTVRKQNKILQTYSATLCYKNLCTKVLLSLQIYVQARKETRKNHQLLTDVQDNDFERRAQLTSPYSLQNIDLTGNQHLMKSSISISNEFVISQAEMGPIALADYCKLKNLPQTMLDESKVIGSQNSSSIKTHSRGPSVLSMNLPLTPTDAPN